MRSPQSSVKRIRTPYGTSSSGGSPPVPAAACGAFADANEEAEQPDHEDDERDPPQDVEDEPEAAQDQGEQENEQDDSHVAIPSEDQGTDRRPWRWLLAHACYPGRARVFRQRGA